MELLQVATDQQVPISLALSTLIQVTVLKLLWAAVVKKVAVLMPTKKSTVAQLKVPAAAELVPLPVMVLSMIQPRPFIHSTTILLPLELLTSGTLS